MLASIGVSIVTFFVQSCESDTHAFADFKTALLASAIVLACFAIWHLARAPWLLHRDAHETKIAARYGVLGIFIVACLLAGTGISGAAIYQRLRVPENAGNTTSPPVPNPFNDQTHQAPPSATSDLVDGCAGSPTPMTEEQAKDIVMKLGEEWNHEHTGDISDKQRWVNDELVRRGCKFQFTFKNAPATEKKGTPTSASAPDPCKGHYLHFSGVKNIRATVGVHVDPDAKCVIFDDVENMDTKTGVEVKHNDAATPPLPH